MRRCIGFARDWGYAGVVLLNLFAYRATSPADMKAQDDPVGPSNDDAIQHHAAVVDRVVAAWGNQGAHQGRSAFVSDRLAGESIPLWALKITGVGEPGHPLYLRRDLEPFCWQPRAGHRQCGNRVQADMERRQESRKA